MDEDELARADTARRAHVAEHPTHMVNITLRGWYCCDCDAQWPWHGGSQTRQRLWDMYLREG